MIAENAVPDKEEIKYYTPYKTAGIPNEDFTGEDGETEVLTPLSRGKYNNSDTPNSGDNNSQFLESLIICLIN